MKKFIEKYGDLLLAICGLLSLSFLIYIMFFENNFTRNNLSIIFSFLIILLEMVLVFLFRNRSNKKNKDIRNLNKLIEYKQKRNEIEHEILALTRELTESDVSEYLDIHRIVFTGQHDLLSNSAIDYNQFLDQFGISKEKIRIKKGSALFLTPFNFEGDRLFNECQSILSKIDVFLQKTDNYVEKDDILMNIVSAIVQSEFIIVNIDGRNPNVYYELGIAHAIGKPTILLSKSEFDLREISFDVRQKRIILYRDYKTLETELLYQINRMKNK